MLPLYLAKYGQGNKSNVFASFNIAVKGKKWLSPCCGSIGTGFTDAGTIDALRRN